MGVEEDYLWVTGNAFSEMRLLIEGAIVLYEGDASALCGLSVKADMPEARYAFNDIGTALYELRRHVETLEREHRLEDLRQRVTSKPIESQ